MLMPLLDYYEALYYSKLPAQMLISIRVSYFHFVFLNHIFQFHINSFCVLLLLLHYEFIEFLRHTLLFFLELQPILFLMLVINFVDSLLDQSRDLVHSA